MKDLFALCLFLNVFLFPAYGQGGEYHLVWQDTFDGNHLDETVWNVEVNGNGGGNNELEYYRKENLSVGKEPVSGESCLIITAKLENYGGKVCTSGRLNTNNRMSFKYGKIEARIKLPQTGNGLWPAFWMMGYDFDKVNWPGCGEIDIMEMGSSDAFSKNTQDKYFSGWFHWGETAANHPNWGLVSTSTYGLQDDFHLWTLVWDANSIKMYLDLDKYPDNNPYVTMNTYKDNPVPGDAAYYFNKPFFVIFNLAIGGNFTGITGNANIGQVTAFAKAPDGEPKMYIDYIKVYQKGDAGEEYNGPKLLSMKQPDVSQQFAVFCRAGVLSVKGNVGPTEMVLYNAAGSKILEMKDVNTVNVSNLPAGIYILKIRTILGREEAYKVMING